MLNLISHETSWLFYVNDLCNKTMKLNRLFGGVSKSMLTLNEAIIDVKKG